MNLNQKQLELVEHFSAQIEARFPEVKFQEALPSPEGANTVLLHFSRPDSDDRFMEVAEFAGERMTEILLDYGYHFVVLPVVPNGEHRSMP
jgi:hypothetical protein